MKNMKKILIGAVSLILAAAVVIAIGIGSIGENGWFTNLDVMTWFNSWGKGGADTSSDEGENKDNSDEAYFADNGGALVSGIENNGIELLSAKLPRSAYAANGISAVADTAFVLTAKVLPEETTDKSVDWSVAFANPSSAWASGKSVTDYVTVAASSDGALTATVTNFAPFGEQIIVTVTSRDNPEATAKCTVDYCQRIESIALKIGNVSVNFNGDTNVTLAIGKDSGGAGGVVALEKKMGDTYTLVDEYTEVAAFTGGGYKNYEISVGSYVAHSSSTSSIMPSGTYFGIYFDDFDNAIGRSIHFDKRIFTECGFKGLIKGNQVANLYFCPMSEMKFADLQTLFGRVVGNILWDISVTVEGKYCSYNYQSVLRMSQIDTSIFADNVEVGPDVIF